MTARPPKRMTARATSNPVLYVIVSYDSGGYANPCDSCQSYRNARQVLWAWRKHDRFGRTWRIVKYAPVPTRKTRKAVRR